MCAGVLILLLIVVVVVVVIMVFYLDLALHVFELTFGVFALRMLPSIVALIIRVFTVNLSSFLPFCECSAVFKRINAELLSIYDTYAGT